MAVNRRRAKICWFGAAWLSVIALILVLAGVSVNAGRHWSTEAFVLVILSGAALVGMAVLMTIAFRNERRDETDRDCAEH